jgi:hypothetical protein
VNFKEFLSFEDSEVPLSFEAKDLILKFLSDPEYRLGVNGINEIIAHPFFQGVKWKDIYSMQPPFIPQLKGPSDTKYFDKYEEEEPWWLPEYDKQNFQKKKLSDYQYFDLNDGDYILKKKL